MNYNTLKTSVAAVIKENGNNEITGDILQQTLIAMINSLGVGYQFMGVAQPSTNPGAPDQRVFYIAAEPGTYTGFNTEVVPGEIAIFKFSNTWLKDSIFAIDLANVGFKGAFESGIGLDPSDGEPIVDVNYDASDYIPVGPGCVIVYSGGETDSNRAAIIGYDEDKYMASVLLAGGSDWKNKIVAITDPDIKYVRVSSCNANHENYNTPFAFNVVATTDVLVKVQELIEDVELLSERIQLIDPVINVIRNGYTFRGIALPNETLTEDVVSTFYWIETAGTYPGGTLAANEVGLLIWNGADWTIEKLNLAKATALATTNEALTALASIVTDILSVVGAGYEYMGVVTPNSVFPADTYKYKVAFLAQTPGTYTNHGAFAIAENEVALLMYDPASEEWSKQTLDVAKLSYAESTYAKQNGEYPEMKVGQAEVAENVASAMEDSPMFTFRKTPVAANMLRIEEIKGNSIAWNQLVQNGDFSDGTTGWTLSGPGVVSVSNNLASFIRKGNANYISTPITLIANHKYFVTLNIKALNVSSLVMLVSQSADMTTPSGVINASSTGYYSVIFTPASSFGYIGFRGGYDSVAIDAQIASFTGIQVIDLTALTMPDLTAPAFEALYPGFHGFNPGAIKNLTTIGMKCTGFNQWDEEWELGSLDNDGQPTISSLQIRSKNFIPVTPNTTYYFNNLFGVHIQVATYDANKNHIGWLSTNNVPFSAAMPSNCYYIKFRTNTTVTSYTAGQFCINISNPDRNGEYEPYREEIVYTNIGGGFNRWNEKWELGEIDNTGAVVSGNRVVSKDFIHVQGNTDYYFHQGTIATGSNIAPVWYDANKAFVSGNTFVQNGIVKSPANARYLKFRMATAYGTTYHNDICISYDVPGLNGTYQPYTVLTGKLDGQGESVELFTDGAKGVGTAHDLIRKNDCDVVMEEVNLGDLTWTKGAASTNEKDIYLSNNVLQRVASNTNVLCAQFMFGGLITTQQQALNYNDGQFVLYSLDNVPGVIGVIQTHGRYADANAFKSAMAGVKLVSQLATPKHYVFDKPLNLMAKTDPDGTQMLLPSQTGMSEPTSAPMLAEIEYYVNALKGVAKVGTLTNVLEALKTAGTISAYTMTWNAATGEYDVTITA